MPQSDLRKRGVLQSIRRGLALAFCMIGLFFMMKEGYLTKAVEAASCLWSQSGSNIHYTSGKVGIGTTNPAHELEVTGTSYPTIFIKSTDTQGGQLWFKSLSGQYSLYLAGGDLRFWNGSDRVTLESNGNVGIGVTSPTTALDVSGVITATGGTSSNWNTAYGWGDHSLGGYLTTESDPQVGTITANYIPRWDGSTLATGTIYDNGSSIGIGVPAPATKLEVSGVITATGGTSSNWNTAYGWGNHASIGYLTSESDPQVGSNTVNYVPRWNGSALVSGQIYDNGTYVGIDTATPTTKLEVYNGVITATGGNSTNWNTAYGWGNHAAAGYLTASGHLRVPRANTTTTISVTDGSCTSITVGADSLPVVSYIGGSTQLYVLKCGNQTCSSGNTTSQADPTGGTGLDSSITTGTDGYPVISYAYLDGGDLKVTKCGNATCSSGNTITTIDSGTAENPIGEYSSITIGTDGYPVISYYDGASDDLKVAKCGNAACSSGNTTYTLDSSGNVGTFTSIAIGLDGFPVISYFDVTNGHLKVAKCGNAACSSGNTLTTADNSIGVGESTSITIGTDGFPVISHRDTTNSALKVVKCNDAGCTGGDETITTVDNSANVGAYRTSITIGPDGYPFVSYYDMTSGNLKIVNCGTASCASGNTIRTLDTGGTDDVGRYSSVAFGIDGLPIVSYTNYTDNDLVITKCGSPTCLEYWTRR